MLGHGSLLNLRYIYTVTIMMFIVSRHTHTCTHNIMHMDTYPLIHMLAYIHRAKDFKNRELFEKMFPELKARREQQERFTRYLYLYNTCYIQPKYTQH